jgi:SHAQKYF class myb-like DNA-binding protein
MLPAVVDSVDEEFWKDPSGAPLPATPALAGIETRQGDPSAAVAVMNSMEAPELSVCRLGSVRLFDETMDANSYLPEGRNLPPVGRVCEPAENTRRSNKSPQLYTVDEKRLFEEALDLYGREWPKVAAHVKTRGLTSIKSHAQKHFIWLAKHGRPVPARVAETGCGHTMNGRPLDLNSATAKGYLHNNDIPGMQRVIDKLYEDHRKRLEAEYLAFEQEEDKERTFVMQEGDVYISWEEADSSEPGPSE